jgi:hypothetical protein
MLAMQYSIPLPADFDAERIRERVKTRHQLFDTHAGLVHKSFLYNDAEQLYAPFYIWKDVGEARDFLLDELFHGVIETFNRHRVRSWVTVHIQHGNRNVKPGYALREIDVIAPEEKLDVFLKREFAQQQELLKNPALYMHMVAIDADRWEILRFALWKDKASAPKPYSDMHAAYDVLHVSEPVRFS